MSADVLEKLNQILTAQGLTFQALVDIESNLGDPGQGTEAQKGVGGEPQFMAPRDG